MQNKLKHNRVNEGGFASIVVAISMIVVLSLITVGFATLMRHEQKSALDKHLSNQALLVAESGINDATQAINAGYTDNKNKCDTSDVTSGMAGNSSLLNPTVGSDANIKYTCLLIDQTPSSLDYDLGTDKTKVIELNAISSTTGSPEYMSKIVISWEPSSLPSNITTDAQKFSPASDASHPFPKVSGGWTRPTGVVRVGVMPVLPGAAYTSRENLLKNNFTAFLYPLISGVLSSPPSSYSAVSYATGIADGQNGAIVNGNCKTGSKPLACNVMITSLTPSSNYLLTLKSFYQSNHIMVTAFDAANNQLEFKDTQALIDSTGKAQDILRRVQARVPLKNGYDMPDNALDVMSGICKQIPLVPATVYSGNTGC